MLLSAWLQLGLMLIGATNSAVWDERRADQHGIWKKMLTSDRDIWFESLSEQEVFRGQAFVFYYSFLFYVFACAMPVAKSLEPGSNSR